MAHSYRKDGPNKDQILFNPDTRVLTIGNYSVTLPLSGQSLESLTDSVATLDSNLTGLSVTVNNLASGVGFTLPTADGDTGVLWNDTNVVKVSV